MSSDLGLQLLSVGDLQLPFHQYVFSHGRSPLYVFYCRWEDRLISQTENLREDGTKISRLRAVLAGRRHLGQQVFEVALSGPDNSDEALAALRNLLPKVIRK